MYCLAACFPLWQSKCESKQEKNNVEYNFMDIALISSISMASTGLRGHENFKIQEFKSVRSNIVDLSVQISFYNEDASKASFRVPQNTATFRNIP